MYIFKLEIIIYETKLIIYKVLIIVPFIIMHYHDLLVKQKLHSVKCNKDMSTFVQRNNDNVSVTLRNEHFCKLSE